MVSWVATSYWILAGTLQPYPWGVSCICSGRALAASQRSPSPGNGRAALRTEGCGEPPPPTGPDWCRRGRNRRLPRNPVSARTKAPGWATVGRGPVWCLHPSSSKGRGSSLCLLAASLPLSTAGSSWFACRWTRGLCPGGPRPPEPPGAAGGPRLPGVAGPAWPARPLGGPGTARGASPRLAVQLSLAGRKLCRIKAFHCCPCLPTPIAIKG